MTDPRQTETAMSRVTYPIEIEVDETGRHVVTFPDFGWGTTDGADRAESLAAAGDCLAEILATTMKAGDPIPEPSPAKGRPTAAPRLLIAAKASLYQALRESDLKKSDLIRELGITDAELSRMLDPAHNTKIDRLEAGMAALGKRLELHITAA